MRTLTEPSVQASCGGRPPLFVFATRSTLDWREGRGAIDRNEDAQLAGGQTQLANFDPDHRRAKEAAPWVYPHTVVSAICMGATVAVDLNRSVRDLTLV